MKIATMEETRRVAKDKWREYRDAEKISDNKVYTDLKKVYNQLKAGRKIIDIGKVLVSGGLNDWHQPNLAIAKITSKFVWCQYNESGRLVFTNASDWGDQGRTPLKEDVAISGMPEFTCKGLVEAGKMRKDRSGWGRMELKAPVPIVPPKILPAKTEGYYVLWEVEEWKIVPPRDPWLLKRITDTLFVALAAWELTEIERSAMAGRLT